MSLVAYDSSDESDREDAVPEPRSSAAPRSLFASLPAPKRSEPGGSSRNITLPSKTKKRSEPVKIAVPELKAASSDSEDEEPLRKKTTSQGGGLSSLLPQPKHLSVKETKRPLVPHTLTKRPTPTTASKLPKPASQGVSGTSPSPSAIKAAAKSKALQFARQMAADEEGSDEELAPENYFSLPESSSEPPAVPYPEPHLFTPSLNPPSSVEDTPLNFGPNAESQEKPVWTGSDYQNDYQLQQDQKPNTEDYYSEGLYQQHNTEGTDQEETEACTLFNDEAFRRLQGKQNRGKEEIKFLEIKGDDQLSGNQQWMMKGMTAEAEPRKSFSKKRGDQPTGQQRRKHQITYLIHQAKERELELKNNWADNKLTRRQTQAKYGF